jgi:hypothetical protein
MMSTLDLLEHVTQVAVQTGYRVRREMLGGVGGGVCEFNNQRWIFVDASLNAHEQLEQIRDSLWTDPAFDDSQLIPMLRRKPINTLAHSESSKKPSPSSSMSTLAPRKAA